MEKYLKRIKELAKEADFNEEVPVGAIIVKDDQIIAEGKNEQYKSGEIHRHAEMNAILEVCRKSNRYELDGTTMFVTLEPCLLCLGAIIEARISKVIYLLESPKYGFSRFINKEEIDKKIEIQKAPSDPEIEELMKKFFESKR